MKLNVLGQVTFCSGLVCRENGSTSTHFLKGKGLKLTSKSESTIHTQGEVMYLVPLTEVMYLVPLTDSSANIFLPPSWVP